VDPSGRAVGVCSPIGFFTRAQLCRSRERVAWVAELLRGEAAAQLFLVANPLIAKPAEDLTCRNVFQCSWVPSLACVCIFIQELHTPVNYF